MSLLDIKFKQQEGTGSRNITPLQFFCDPFVISVRQQLDLNQV